MLSNLDDPTAMGPGLAAALMTTLYGIVLSRFIFYPVAEKIKNSASINRFRETFMLEGIILINEKKTAFFIQDKLVSKIIDVTTYGSIFDAGRRSSRYPFHPSFSTDDGTRIEAPRSATP